MTNPLALNDALKPGASDLFAGKRVLFAGATGFVGKVALSMLLHRYPELDKVWVLVRKGSAPSSQDRWNNKIMPSEPFDPIRERYGDKAAAFFAEKCAILDGDITDPNFGLSDQDLAAIDGKVDAVINCAGLVNFDPTLELGINVNVVGCQNAVDLCKRLKAPLVHVSTCFVAGNRSGLVFEDEPIVGYFPKKDEFDGRDFDVDQELKDGAKLIAQIRERADDRTNTSVFRKAAVERLEAEGRDPKDEKTLRLAIGRERKLWLTGELVKLGMDRAAHWGWPNTYTYTKSLGEQVIARAGEQDGLSYAIVRPSIVESSLRYPFPGWNEGFTTSAPLAFLGLKGQRSIPAHEKCILDIIPVDLVCGALIAVTGAIMKGKAKRVYQLASGDVNPFYTPRSVELVGLYRRKFYREKKTGNQTWNELLSKMEPQSVSKAFFKTLSAPGVAKLVAKTKEVIEEKRPKWGMPTVDAVLSKVTNQLDEIEYQTKQVDMLMDVFMPFIWHNHYVFRCDNTRAVYETGGLNEADKARIPWDPEKLDWRDYFLNVHMAGLEKWVFPGLEEEREKKVHNVRTYRDLLEMFEASVYQYKTRVAFRYYEGEKLERFTYAEVDHYAARVAAFLLMHGMKRGDRVLVCGENRPEWPISYFGIVRGGGTAVPTDNQLTEAEVTNIARSSGAFAILITEKQLEKLPELQKKFAEGGLKTHIWTIAQAFAGDPAVNNGQKKQPHLKTANPDDLASVIYTSGTTGTPKGVMLSQRNFTSLLSKLAQTFELAKGDGLLSVLPLHHTFEFSCGLLLPFSRGAEINYIDELTSDRLGEALEDGRITAMIGVPALFQLLHRKITQELAAKPGFVESGAKLLMDANEELRTKWDMNFGKLLFWPIHRKFGGKIRLMVSGGSALSDDVHKAFHSMGFNIAEGYGLTEAAPVLSVSKAENDRLKGSVGRALPGIEIKILEPDAEGIGEVIARGPNIMSGYFENREATDAVLKEGWLYTGDLGRLDEEGNLFLVGRKKDVIIDANGKNVYPDELEELYQDSKDIKELSIVGLPDEAGGEKVACLVVPEYGDEDRDTVRGRIEEHFRKVSGGLPFYRRVKLMHFFDGVLEKTSTRKVKRKWVVEQLKGIERAAATGAKAREAAKDSGDSEWLLQIIADVSQQPRAKVRRDSKMVELGFDSLMLTELGVALEQAGVALPKVEDLTQVETVADLSRLIGGAPKKKAAVQKRKLEDLAAEERRDQNDKKPEKETNVEVPDAVAKAGRALVSLGQKALFSKGFKLDVTGKAYIPQNSTFIVAANHASHLDMGVIKVALGEQGERLTALAARDYFFDKTWKRAWFENFSNLIPMDREGSLKKSLRLAGEALAQGFNLLIFPEGTRSATGELQEFKPTLGFLALQHNVDILPMYIAGAYDALPRGSVIPRSRDLKARIGTLIRVDELREMTKGMSRSQAYKVATKVVEDAVIALRDGKPRKHVKPPKPAAPPPSSKKKHHAHGGGSSEGEGGEPVARLASGPETES